MKWFKHDSNAHTDAKLKKVKHRYGITGYGLYWYCIELIASGVEKTNITFELEEDAETIATEWSLDQIKVQEIMSYMVGLGLFENDEGRITCLKLAKRLDDTNSKNPEIKMILAKLGINKSESLGETPNMSDQTRLDKKRTEENKKDIFNEAKASPINVDSDSLSKGNQVPYKKIVDLYHKVLPELRSVAKISATRQAQIRQRWIQDLPSLEEWQEYFEYVRQSDFLMGKVNTSFNQKNHWEADFDFLIKESNAIKIAEGKYHG